GLGVPSTRLGCSLRYHQYLRGLHPCPWLADRADEPRGSPHVAPATLRDQRDFGEPSMSARATGARSQDGGAHRGRLHRPLSRGVACRGRDPAIFFRASAHELYRPAAPLPTHLPRMRHYGSARAHEPTTAHTPRHRFHGRRTSAAATHTCSIPLPSLRSPSVGESLWSFRSSTNSRATFFTGCVIHREPNSRSLPDPRRTCRTRAPSTTVSSSGSVGNCTVAVPSGGIEIRRQR